MDDILDYSRKLREETSKLKKFFVVICIIVSIFSFSIGFYLSYVFNKDTENKNQTKLDAIYDILSNEWYYGKEDENIEKTLIDKAIYGMLDTEKDPFTMYLTSLGSLANSYDGLGITIVEYKEYFMITSVASFVNMDENKGLKNGDILKSIDGNDLKNKDSSYIKTLLADKESVEIVVERNGTNKTITGYITTYTPVTVFQNFSYSNEMAYIQISEFGLDTGDELEDSLKEAKEAGYNKLIIDLRDNPGGYITSVVECADLFLEKNKVVLTTKDRHDNAYSYKTTNNDKYDFSNIVILINNNSASGAEALSAALDYHLDDKVDLVGVTTYGKGSAQKTVYFTDGTYFHYTYALWYTPEDVTIHNNGVKAETIYTGSGLHTKEFSAVELKETDYGQNVKNLQKILDYLNYYSGEETGYFDSALKESLIQFQKDNNIEQTGKLDRLTIRYLLAKSYDDKIIDYKNEIQEVLSKYSA